VFGRIDHIGIAVEDIDAGIELYEKSFGMELGLRETVEEQGVEAALLNVGDGHVELMAPTGPDTPVGKFLAKPRVGIGGSRVAFLQPRSTGRVLTEIVEPPGGEH
jgi:catechol 2,3-dioxygenase-like lactoylglutathione lyase family enzyme